MTQEFMFGPLLGYGLVLPFAVMGGLIKCIKTPKRRMRQRWAVMTELFLSMVAGFLAFCVCEIVEVASFYMRSLIVFVGGYKSNEFLDLIANQVLDKVKTLLKVLTGK